MYLGLLLLNIRSYRKSREEEDGTSKMLGILGIVTSVICCVFFLVDFMRLLI